MARIGKKLLLLNIDGTEDADHLEGTAGDDLMFGYGGDDTFNGSAGADRIDGGEGEDQVFYRYSPEAVMVNLTTRFGAGGDAAGDTYVSIEHVFGSWSFDDVLIGNESTNYFVGFGGDDMLDGAGGDDGLWGGDGADTLYGGTGNDELFGDAGVDNLDGGGGDDWVRSSDADRVLDGGEGNDRVTIDRSASSADFRFVLAENLSPGGTQLADDTWVVNFEAADFFGGSGKDHLETTGSAFGTELNGGADDDTLIGGNDVGDYFIGGAGNDTITGGAGDGYAFDAYGPADRAVFSSVRSDYSIVYTGVNSAIVTDLRDGSPDGADTLDGIELLGFADTVMQVNQAPTDITLASASVAENAAIGTIVGTAVGSDPNPGEALRYYMLDDAGGRFAIDYETGAVSVVDGSLLDAELSASHQIQVRLFDSDGQTVDRWLTIAVTDVNEAPTIGSNGGVDSASVSIAENSLAVATVAACDPDDGATLGYSIVGGDDEALFTIDANSGALRFLAPPDYETRLDANHDNVYDVQVRASDGALSDTQTIAVTVTDRNEAPVIGSNGGLDSAAVSVSENSTAVTTVTARDPDAIATIAYAIAGGADAARFTIDANTGALRFIAAPDFELRGDANGDNVYDVQVRASDGQLSDTQAIAVKVTDVAESSVGTPGNDVLVGTPLGDQLRGLAGNDTLAGLGGGDTLDGGAGIDTADYSASPRGVIVNLGTGVALLGDAQGDRLVSIEQILGSAFNDSLIGDGAANYLNGNDGNDGLVGGAGDDVLVGGLGDDSLFGGAGDDVLLGGPGGNWLDGGAGADYLEGGDQFDLLIGGDGADTLIGGGGSDILEGGAGTDVIVGGLGDDELSGGAGADSLRGGEGRDTVFYTYPGSSYGVTVDLALGTAAGGDAEGDTLLEIENVYGSRGYDVLRGDEAANTLDGGAGNDILSGFRGNDLIIGGIGQDILSGGSGTDTFQFGGLLDSPVGTGADTILDFGHGIDSIDLSVLDARTNVAGNQAFAFIGGAAFSGISGQLRYQYDLATQTTRCFADVNGDRAPDFQINLAGQIALTASDFIL